MTNLFFLRGLVSTARKCLLAVLRKQFTPVVERTVSNTQIARDLTHRLPAGLYELYRFDLKFPCIRSLCLLHDPCPFRVGFTLPSLLPSLLRVKTKPHVCPGDGHCRRSRDGCGKWSVRLLSSASRTGAACR